MSWWCAAVERPWDWTWRPYVGVWIFCGLFIAGWIYLWRRRGEHPTRRANLQFAGAIAFLWIASDWPVGALGGGYLSSVHMLQFMMYTLAAAPLLMLATPEWMAEGILARLRLRRVWEFVSKPLVAAIATNGILLATHSPFAVDLLRASQMGSFVLDMIWLVAGFIMWAPIVNPIRDLRPTMAGTKILYLFCAAALVPMIPGGFIAFAPSPLYSTYELAPRAGLSAIADQQLAGVLMKVGNIPIIWTVMAVIWFRWYDKERRESQSVRQRRSAAARTANTGSTTGSSATAPAPVAAGASD